MAADRSLAHPTRSSVLPSPLLFLLVKADAGAQAGATAIRRASGPVDAVLLRSVGGLDGTPGRRKAEKVRACREDPEKRRRLQVVPLLEGVHAGSLSRAEAFRADCSGPHSSRLDSVY